jgi:tRNA 5-methylaminomethyl-2-thiouridine biosynthesis bifunctional protein
MTLDWQDGLPYSTRFGDVYFSAESGLEETYHVFLHGNRLAERFAALGGSESFTIGETGFGTGLNFLCAWRLFEQAAPPGASLDFFSIEKFPLSDEELRAALALWPELGVQAEALLARWRRRVPGWNRWSFGDGRVRLTLTWSDVADAVPEVGGRMDAWFLDGFSPAKNSDMWAQRVLDGVARASRAGATLATYTSAGWVRRGLQQAGFEMERVQGFGRKREMMRGTLAASTAHAPSFRGGESRGGAPSNALVIGGGLAGCAAAHALARRGVAVTLMESAPTLASAASGNPRGILHARFGVGMNELHRLVLAAYGHALALLDEVLPADGVLRAECGLLQLAAPEGEARRIARLAVMEWPEHLLQVVDAAEASRLAGIAMAHGGLWFPAGGWVVPPQVCERLASHLRIVRQFGRQAALERTASGWRASGGDWQLEAERVVVCCGYQARKLAQFATFALQAVRGQISELPATTASKRLRAVVCAEGYCAPAMAGRHVAGATTVFDDEAVELRAAEHADNLAKLAAHMPALFEALGAPDAGTLTGRAAVRCSVPGAMPLVGEVEPGLYCSLAHGTRGLLTAGIAGEAVAAAMCGQFAPLPRSILAALAPGRFFGRKAALRV